MHNKFTRMALLVLIPLSLHAARFEVKNGTAHEIVVALTCADPGCSGKSCKNSLCNKNGATGEYDRLQSQQAETYDTGFADLLKIGWMEKVAGVVTSYEVNIKVNALNLGGHFDIQTEGRYTYDFGVDGKDSTKVKGVMVPFTSWSPKE